MKAPALVSCVLGLSLVSACSATVGVTPAGGIPQVGGVVVGAPGVGEDVHFIQADDYFVSDSAYESGWIRPVLAKMKQPPVAGTKNEAQFFLVNEAKDLWTAHFWRTRLAVQTDMAVGNLLVCFEGNSVDDVYRAPANKEQARTGAWFLGRVTDVSDLFKNVVSIAQYKCGLDAARAPVQ